ncbi:MAG TPA: hypothetical protein VHP37_16585 [Burkholderiales bacterium]|nr:hypothetical protein [Burkholderiales bacterium]
MKHLIEARSFRVLFAGCHNFWVLKNANGHTLAELHGLAYDRVNKKVLPIGTTKNHGLRVFAYAHDESYARASGLPMGSTRMYWKSRVKAVYQGEDALARWNAALKAMPLLDGLDLDYPPFGFNVLSATVNSNSAYRTFGEIMGVPIPTFAGVLGPGCSNRMLAGEALERLSFRAARTDARA